MSQVTTAPPPVSPPKGWQQRLRESRLGTVLVLVVTAVVVMAGAYLVQRTSGTATEAGGTTATNVVAGKGAAPQIGSPAQDFSATTVDDKQISLTSLKGQSEWLTFGATWCAACVSEAPDVQAASEKFTAKGVVVLSIQINEDPQTVKDYADRTGLTFPKVADPQSSIASQYRVFGIPAHLSWRATSVTAPRSSNAAMPVAVVPTNLHRFSEDSTHNPGPKLGPGPWTDLDAIGGNVRDE